MRFRNQFTEEFFGTNGETTIRTRESKPMDDTTETPSAPIRPINTPAPVADQPSTTDQQTVTTDVAEISANTDNQIEDPKFTIGQITDLSNAIQPSTTLYVPVTPRTIEQIEEEIPSTDYNPMISSGSFSGGGVGFGGGGSEESRIPAPQETNNKAKKAIVITIIIAVALYAGYQFFKNK